MYNISVKELAKLLKEAADAHHLYETTELKGVHDEDWAIWYAQWILDKLS